MGLLDSVKKGMSEKADSLEGVKETAGAFAKGGLLGVVKQKLTDKTGKLGDLRDSVGSVTKDGVSGIFDKAVEKHKEKKQDRIDAENELAGRIQTSGILETFVAILTHSENSWAWEYSYGKQGTREVRVDEDGVWLVWYQETWQEVPSKNGGTETTVLKDYHGRVGYGFKVNGYNKLDSFKAFNEVTLNVNDVRDIFAKKLREALAKEYPDYTFGKVERNQDRTVDSSGTSIWTFFASFEYAVPEPELKSMF